MKAAFALLADRDTSNFVRKTAWDLHRNFQIGVRACRLPPHVSLKQPFDIDDIDGLETFLDAFAASLSPFEIKLSHFQLWELSGSDAASGTISIALRESPLLREAHNRLNRELKARFGETQAEFDGDAYQFHMTVATGEGSLESYRAAVDACHQLAIARTLEARDLGLFVYDKSETGEWQYMHYRSVLLGNVA